MTGAGRKKKKTSVTRQKDFQVKAGKEGNFGEAKKKKKRKLNGGEFQQKGKSYFDGESIG